MTGVALALLLLAPEGTHELKLLFEKGMVYEEASARRVKFRNFAEGRVFRYDKEDECVVRRTVLEVGEDGLPSRERVEVLRSLAKINEAPDAEPGVSERPAQGKTFTWQRKEKGFVLYEGEEDVSEKHPDLIQRLRGRCVARLPKGPVGVGATWEVSARDFVESDGKAVPEGLGGKVVFKLEEVKDGVARITFDLKLLHRNRDKEVAESGGGIWLFDVAKGRELKLDAEGKIEIDAAKAGFGSQKMSRTLTYP
jgi:hypothetical protein